MKARFIFILLFSSSFSFAQRMQMFQTMQKQSDQISKVISYANRKGYRAPTGDGENALRKFYKSFIDNSITTKLDALYVPATGGYRRFAGLNLLNPSTNEWSYVNQPKFDRYLGISTNTVASNNDYIVTNWSPSNGVNYTQNSAEHFYYWSYMTQAFSTGQSDGARDAAGVKESSIGPFNSSTVIAARTNSVSSATITDTQFTLGDDYRFFGRIDASTEFGKQGTNTRITSSQSSTTRTSNPYYIGSLDEAGAPRTGTYNKKMVKLFGVGSLLTTTDEANIKTAFDTYMSDLSTAQLHESIGTIYNATTWSSLSDFTNNGSTSSIVSNAIQFSGGAGTYTQSLDLNNATKLDKWVMVAQVKVGTKVSNSFGFGLGIRSINNHGTFIDAIGQFNMTSGANAGKLVQIQGTSHTTTTSSSALSFSVNDVIELTVELYEHMLFVSARNVTTSSATISMPPAYYSSTLFLPNTGRFSIFSFGGTFTVQSLNVSSKETKKPLIAIIGDSKTQWYTALAQNQCWSYLLRDDKEYNIAVLGGGSDTSIDYVARLNDLTLLQPKYVVIAGISNDIRYSISSGTWQSNLQTILSTCNSNGWIPIFLDGLYETSVSQSAVTTYMSNTSNIPAQNFYSSVGTTLTLNADLIHPDTGGHATFKALIAAAGILP